MRSPSANSSEVSSQSTLPSFRAMKPSRLATMWIVTRELFFSIVSPCHKDCAFALDGSRRLGAAELHLDRAKALVELPSPVLPDEAILEFPEIDRSVR